MTSRRFGFTDIGTNTILCLIAELKEDGSFLVLDDLAEIARLGAGVHQSGVIGSEAEDRSLQVLRRYVKRCQDLEVEQIVAVGTSALREARNSAEVRARFKEELGVDVRVLSGDQEARYSFLAVQQGLPLNQRGLLVVDVGGGSTELIRGDEAGVSQAVSLNIGSVRLTEQFLHSDPVRREEYDKLMAAVETELATLPHQWLRDNSRLTLVGIAGTFTTLAAIDKKLVRYSHGEVHGSRLTLNEVRRQVALFLGQTIAQRRRIPGLEPMRADVILAGACLIEKLMTLFCADEVIVSDQGVRYGLLYERLTSADKRRK
jgi:exopolyphosphatase/guanosine-5'-triphosphate,3'-diphosphate pyrophosphatase